ncbi:MAG: hypothetical protein P1P86_13545 [Bacteroidales bacterium]|nr:hypothetical protein [Bacteroidales bacterium]
MLKSNPDIMKRFFSSVFMLLLIISLKAQPLDMELLQGMKARSIGPGGMSGRVTAIDVENRNNAVFYIGTASGGLWKTENGGVNFTPLFDREEVSSIGALAIDPSNEDIIWAGTGEGNPRNSLNGGYGIYKSLDGGRNWTLMGLERTRHIHRILVHPSNPEVVYVGAIGSPWGPHPERGVYKTTDGGRNWKQILYANDLSGVADMVMDPRNPDKLFVAMWEHRRWPWFFKSGGGGSGLHMTVDGGETWKQLSSDDGLPRGELGRIGLAIARGNNKYVYALIESKKNAIYRSTDGGYSWTKRGDRNMGNRPFYYSEIYVDPANENRVYTLFSPVNVSEDGGKSYSTLLGQQIHVDHHAWWIDPGNPDFMIDGNDGGMAITYDRGKSWRHVSNLPVSQFYHIRTDMELPYNVYGGMQDNGSWKGPGYLWSSGGIINTYWEFLMGGDGFDVLPVPGEPGLCYAMSQQGNVRRIDIETGNSLDIKPAADGDTELRFHWNSAIAQDPFHPNTIYFGSQFLHKSEDRGDSWMIISPDLSTNDTAKQKFNESGGLTYDVTGAENHTCILAISPSPLEEGVIWAGTDDGNIQLTTDGGESWTNCAPGIKELPEGAWVPQITASEINRGEAWVVVNNYRQNDYAPYLFHTSDYGKRWERVVGPSQVKGFVLSFVQDPEEPRLQFLGTEHGLWVSIDGGAQWTRWTVGYPTVPTMDLVIHPREHDLVIGTFGRAAYIIDDISPLRVMAGKFDQITSSGISLFEPPVAYLADTRNAPGYYFSGDAYFEGENRPRGARISYYARVEESSGEEKKDSVTLTVMDQEMKPVRTLKRLPENGLNRMVWNLDRKGVRLNFSERGPGTENREPGGGGPVLPGRYRLEISYKGDTAWTFLRVEADPRREYDMAGMKMKQEKSDLLLDRMHSLNEALTFIRECKESYELVEKLTGDHPSDGLKEVTKLMKKELDRISGQVFINESVQGIYQPPDALFVKMRGTNGITASGRPLTENQLKKLDQYISQADKSMEMIGHFKENEWKRYSEQVQADQISLIR